MKRVYEESLNELLGLFPCVAIVGPRQCGKTTLLKTLPDGWTRFDLERQADFDLISQNPDLFFKLHPEKIAIDEAQNLPQLFNALRVAIDDRRNERGRFVITGSSSPDLLKSVSESLAGRIAIIEMAPFSWSEIHPVSGTSFVSHLCDTSDKPKDLIKDLKSRADLKAAHDYWFRGGYPEPWLNGSDRFRTRWMEQYSRTYLDRDIGKLFPRLDQIKFRLFLQHMVHYSGTVINHADVARALGVSQPTARDYLEIAHGTFVWRRIPAFSKGSSRRLVRHSKGYLRDSGLLHYLLRLTDLDSLLHHPCKGISWEGMVIEEILRQLHSRSYGFDYSYFRTLSGSEIDLLLEGQMGLVAVEIKYGQSADWRTVKTIETFMKEYKAKLGIVICNGDEPRLISDKIISIPFSHL